MTELKPKELDMICLTEQVERWPAGTEATILEDEGDHFLVEVSEASGAGKVSFLDSLVEVPRDAVRVVWKVGDPVDSRRDMSPNPGLQAA